LELSDEEGAEQALIKIFANMMKEIIDRLNMVPEKNFIAFLETLGIKLLPANAANAPITFLLSEGTKEPVLIPAKTQIAAGDEIFETQKNMLATPSKLQEAYCVDVIEDKIYRSPLNVVTGESNIPFSTFLSYDAEPNSKNIILRTTEGLKKNDTVLIGESEHAIVSDIIGNRVMLSGEIEGLQKQTEESETIKFENYPSGTIVEKVTEFTLFEGKNLQEHILYLGHETLFNVTGEVIITIKSVNKSDSLDLGDIRWEYWGEATKNNDKVKIIDWHRLTGGKILKDGHLKIKKESWNEENIEWKSGKIKEKTINGVKSHWIRTISSEISKTRKISIDDLQIKVEPTPSETIEYIGNPPVIAIRGIGKKFSDRLVDNGIETVDKLIDCKIEELKDKLIPSKEELKSAGLYQPKQSSFYYLEQAKNILENAKKGIFDNEYENYSNVSVIHHKMTKFFLPDIAFYNDMPLNLESTKKIYPFGKTPRINDTFYIGSQEAFSKKNSQIELSIEGYLENKNTNNQLVEKKVKFLESYVETPPVETPPSIEINPFLSFECWDGKGWIQLETDLQFKNNTYTIKNSQFPELKPILINGKENYWIRIRLVGGNYGKEVKIDGTNTKEGNVTPPVITNLSITYDYGTNFQKLEHIITYNNLEYVDKTAEFNKDEEIKSFQPFLPLEDESQILYFGFDGKLEKGPINLFFSINELNWPEDNLPNIKWQYYSEKNEWKTLETSDDTSGFTRTGTIEFVFPSDFKQTKRFGKGLFWIRAVDDENAIKLAGKETKKIGSEPQIPSADSKNKIKSPKCLEKIRDEIISCSEVDSPEWIFPGELKNGLNPKLSGIYTNTVWAVCSETVKDEIIGSSDGTKLQKFNLIRNPVISEEIWVNEIKTITDNEKRKILEKNLFEAKEIKDEHGKTTEFWVKWNPVDDILFSESDERVYEINKFSGEISFGNQKHGKIPPIGSNNIKVDYIIGGGLNGNKPINQIKDIKSSIPFVDKAFNNLASSGGSDIENIESAMERVPRDLKNRNRAISSEDFENITYQASRAISRVKCLSNTNNNGEYEPGHVTILVIPQSIDKRPKLSLQLKKQVQAHLKAHSANTTTLNVTDPLYVETSLTASIITVSPDVVPDVEKEALSVLDKFLHPITGGYDGRGWEFGRAPCTSDFYALLEKIPGVDHVELIEIKLKDYESNVMISSEIQEDIKIPPYAVVYNGLHKLNLNVVKTGGVS